MTRFTRREDRGRFWGAVSLLGVLALAAAMYAGQSSTNHTAETNTAPPPVTTGSGASR